MRQAWLDVRLRKGTCGLGYGLLTLRLFPTFDDSECVFRDEHFLIGSQRVFRFITNSVKAEIIKSWEEPALRHERSSPRVRSFMMKCGRIKELFQLPQRAL